MNNNYNNYKQARDAAWHILIDCKIDRLPVHVGTICKHYGYKLYAYSRNTALIEHVGLTEHASRTDGFTVCAGGTYYIFYNDRNTTIQRQRFTVAHEIGHIQLQHIGDAQYTRINREPAPHDDPAETQANQFAARLLAPACVLHELHALQPDQIAKLCGISMTAAAFRAERIKILEDRNRFYLSPLERAVRDQFRQFIDHPY